MRIVSGLMPALPAYACVDCMMPRRWRRSDAAARGQNLAEFRALLHLEMRDRAVAVPDLEVKLRVVLGTFGHCIAALAELSD